MRRFLPIAVILVLILIAAIVLTLHIWNGVGEDSVIVNSQNSHSVVRNISPNGIMAMVLGAVGSLVLGGGLMALVFISARKGYDDAADAANQTAHPHDRTSLKPYDEPSSKP